MLQMPRYNELKVWFQIKCVQKVWKKGKKSCHQLDSNPQPLERQSGAISVELRLTEECSSSFLYTFAFNSLCRANRSTHELTVTKLE